jgi:hypothetical protein
MATGVDWRISGVELVTCNCDYGCPCQFNALPTRGNCRAAAAYRIDQGHFGDVPLDGVAFVGLFAWPKAIHEGHGEAMLIVDEQASEAQRRAVHTIFRGEETEPGATIFDVFSNVIDTYHEPLYGPIEVELDPERRIGRFAVPGLVEGHSEPIRNPVTGAEHRARVTLPHGFEYHEAEYASSTTRTSDGPIELDWQGRHAHFARLEWTRNGPIHA